MRTYSSLKIERAIVVGFLSVISAGALFIWSFGRIYARPIPLLDAFFTATSATCVTGLIVTDTALLPVPSQVTVSVLIQLGGLGVMTVTTGLLLFVKGRVGLHEGLYLAGSLNVSTPSGARSLVLRVWGIAFLVESCGAVLLFFGFRQRMPFWDAVWHAAFHSVSAFCNAGFSLHTDNLLSYSQTLAVPAAIMALIVIGGLGFLVFDELCFALLSRRKKLSPHAALVLWMTLSLILAGALLLFLAERRASLAELEGWGWKLWNSLFTSVSSRTAGFNTAPMERTSALGVFWLTLLMLIGASPGSTGGGLKTTTFGLMCLSTFHHLQRTPRALFRRRSIAPHSVLMALTLAMTYLFAFLSGGVALYSLSPVSLQAALFEVASALGTVGLSLGITPQLPPAGKGLLILMMFLGRVGILTFVFGFTGHRVAPDNVAYPQADIPIG